MATHADECHSRWERLIMSFMCFSRPYPCFTKSLMSFESPSFRALRGDQCGARRVESRAALGEGHGQEYPHWMP
jgi:hypothetical protein